MEKRVLFLGQKPVGERALEILLESESHSFKVVAICSNETSDEVWWRSNRIARLAGSRLFIPNRSKNEDLLHEAIVRNGINAIVSVQHPFILSERIIDSVSGLAFNLHNAKLPDYRGYNAANHIILNGESHHTSTVHWIAPAVDRGDIAFTETIEIALDETARSLYVRSAKAGIVAFRKLVQALLFNTEIPRTRQDNGGTFYPRNSIKGLNEIKDLSDHVEVDRKSRAFYFPPFEPAYFMRDNRKFFVLPATADPGAFPQINWED